MTHGLHGVYGVYGASGFGREVMPLARRQLERDGVAADDLVFVDDGPVDGPLNGHRVLTHEAFVAEAESRGRVVIAIADPVVRAAVAARCRADGIGFFSVIADSVVVLDDVRIGDGAVLCDGFTVTSNVTIGDHFHGNLRGYVAHDCRIGDFVTFAPAVCCNGAVHVGDGAYVGTGALLRQGRPDRPAQVGAGATVGMGAVVLDDIEAGATVVGNPAHALTRT